MSTFQEARTEATMRCGNETVFRISMNDVITAIEGMVDSEDLSEERAVEILTDIDADSFKRKFEMDDWQEVVEYNLRNRYQIS